MAHRAASPPFINALVLEVEPTYQYSLEWFVEIYLLAIKTAEKPERNLARRLQALQDRFIQLAFQKVCDSLFEKHKLMYSLLLTFKSMEVDKEVDMEEKVGPVGRLDRVSVPALSLPTDSGGVEAEADRRLRGK